MGKETMWGILITILLFISLAGFFASKMEVTLPYTANQQSVLDYAWDNFTDWINPFN